MLHYHLHTHTHTHILHPDRIEADLHSCCMFIRLCRTFAASNSVRLCHWLQAHKARPPPLPTTGHDGTVTQVQVGLLRRCWLSCIKERNWEETDGAAVSSDANCVSCNDLVSPAGANSSRTWMMAAQRHVYHVVLKGLYIDQLHFGPINLNPSSCSTNWHI